MSPQIRALFCAALFFFSQPLMSASARVDINTANAATLAEKLPGIGPVKAAAIILYRQAHGPFASVEAIAAVKGIGPATIKRLSLLVRVASQTSASATGLSYLDQQRAAKTAVRDLVKHALQAQP